MAGDGTAENPDGVGDDQDRASTSQTSGTKRSTPESNTSSEGNASLNDVELDPERRKEARKMRRVMANRRSARESRERRKKLLLDLQESVESLTTENAELCKENLSLRQKLASLVEQAGGAAALSMIPNIQSLLQSTQGLAGFSVQSPSVASGTTGSTATTGGTASGSISSIQGVAGLPPYLGQGRGDTANI